MIRALRRRIRRAFAQLDSLTRSLSWTERNAILADVRTSIIDIRKMEGTIQNPETWQELHTLANKLDEAFVKFWFLP